MEQILLVDSNDALVAVWKHAFADCEKVSVHQADYFAYPADAMVSPANSFGIMYGGLDHAIRNELGFPVGRSCDCQSTSII